MAGSTSLPSVVAVYPAISWPGGLRTGCRRVYLATSASLWSRAVCRHNGVRVLWGAFQSSGMAQCRARNGVRASEEAKPTPKSRRRVKKSVKAVEEVLEGQVPVQFLPTETSEVRLHVIEGPELGSEQSTSSHSVTPVAKKKRTARGRQKKVSEVNGSSLLSEGQDTDTEVLQEKVDKTSEVSTNGAEEESVDASQDANAKIGSRRRGRNSTKRDGAAKSVSNSNSKLSQTDQHSETEMDINGEALEISDSDVESPVDIINGEKKLSTPSVSRARRKKNANFVSQEAPTNRSVAAAVNVEDLSSNSKDSSMTEEDLLSPFLVVQNEHVHGDSIGSSEEQSDINGSISVAEARVDKKESKKSPRPRSKRGKVAKDVKLSGGEELQSRVQETALSSLNDKFERFEGGFKTGEISEEIVNEGYEAELIPADSNAESDVYNDKADVEVKKKKRPRKASKKPVAVAVLNEDTLEQAEVAQSVLLVETTGSEFQSNSSSEEDEAAGLHLHPIDNQEDLVLHTPPEFGEAGSPGADVPKTRSRKKRQGDAKKKVIVQAKTNSEGEGSDTPLESGGVEEVKGTSRVQFPAPTWGPQWWDEIQTKSQATISFQDIAERKEGIQSLTTVSQEPVPEDGVTAEMKDSAEKRTDHIKGNGDSGALNRETRRREELEKSGRRTKLRSVQKSPVETPDEWLKERMLTLVKPTEEPWLLESIIAAETEESSREVQIIQRNEVMEAPATIEEPRKVFPLGSDLSRPDTGDVKKEPEVEVEILINTSECTMQRMAILENKKVVEFSIEPVNTKVQVGNIYLGRVKQLLPGMSGVFVDIGGSRLALLDIARNQYPYTFPPVFGSENHSSNNSANGASLQDEDLGLSEEDADYTEEEEDDDEDEEGHEEEIARNIQVDGVAGEAEDSDDLQGEKGLTENSPKAWKPHKQGSPITVNFGRKFSKWRNVEEGMPIIVQVKKESMGKKGPRLTAFPSLAGRFWVLIPRGNAVGVSARITGPERRRLKLLAQKLQPEDLGITVRTEAIGHEQEELERDLTRLIDTWKEITEKAAAAALAVERGEEAAVPVLLHREMGQTLTIIRDLFTEKISRLVVDSAQSYQEVINYLQEVAPHLMSRVVFYSGKVPIFDKFNVEADLERFFSERVKLPNGGYLVMQETEALVSIDVNGGTGMLGHCMKQREAILNVNLAAAKQIAFEIRLRDIGGIIVVDFIDMDNAEDERLVHEEMRKAILRDRSKVSISEISEYGLMEMTRKRVRPSVTYTIHSACGCCRGTGRVEALETTLSKIERAIRRVLADHPDVSSDASTWPQILLRVELSMLEFLKSWKKKRIIQLGHSLKVWISLKAGMELSRGQFEVMEVPRLSSKKLSAGAPPGPPPTSLQQEQAVTSPVLGKRVWPKRKRFFS